LATFVTRFIRSLQVCLKKIRQFLILVKGVNADLRLIYKGLLFRIEILTHTH